MTLYICRNLLNFIEQKVKFNIFEWESYLEDWGFLLGMLTVTKESNCYINV